jgi:hypothetical protein
MAGLSLGGLPEESSSGQKFGSIPSSYIEWITTQMLWQRTLHRASLNFAVSLLQRNRSPNFALIMLNVVSEFERL